MKIEYTITANKGLIQGNGWRGYDRVTFKDSLLLNNLKKLVKENTELTFAELHSKIETYVRNKQERSNVDIMLNQDTIEISKPFKILPTIWVIKLENEEI